MLLGDSQTLLVYKPVPSRQGGEPLGWKHILKGLILAQNERWRRGLGMQVERIPRGLLLGGSGERGSKAWVTYPGDGDSLSNERVIPGDLTGRHRPVRK
jgi:hypothetical protein